MCVACDNTYAPARKKFGNVSPLVANLLVRLDERTYAYKQAARYQTKVARQYWWYATSTHLYDDTIFVLIERLFLEMRAKLVVPPAETLERITTR